MKNAQIILLPALTLIFIILMSFTFSEKEKSIAPNQGDKFEIPTEIQDIFDKSCFGCHNSESQSDKAKKKLLIDQLPDLAKSKQLAKLDNIVDVLNENEMPPAKFLKKYPDKKLTDSESELLKVWAEKTAEELMK